MFKFYIQFILLIYCIYFGISSFNYPVRSLSEGGGAAMTPLIISCLMFIFLLVNLWQQRFELKDLMRKKKFKIKLPSFYWIIFIITLSASPVLLYYFGFRLAATIVLFLLIFSLTLKERLTTLEMREIILILFISIGFTQGIGWFFENVLRVLLPRGILF